MTADETTRERIQQIVRDNPRQSAADIARHAGVSRQRAHQLLDDLEYELVVYWRKRKP